MASRGKLILGGLAIAVLATCAYQCTSAEPPGAPMWTEADLPALPAAEDNGWQRLQDALDGGFEVPEMPEPIDDTVALLGDDSPQDSWERLISERDALGRFMASSDATDALEAWRRSMDAPTFADACPMVITANCRHFGMFRLHRLALAEAMWLAVRGDVEIAFVRTTAMIRQQARYLDSARGPMGARVSVAMLRASLALGAMLHHRVDEGAEVSASVLDAYREALESIDLDRAILEQLVIGEYLFARDALAQVKKAEGSEMLGDTFWPPRWLYDEGYAAARVDEAYEAVIAVARDPAAPIPEMAEPDWAERVLHPVSAMLLMALDPRMLLANQVAEMRGELSEVESARSALLRD